MRTLGYVLLGLLARESLSGYELTGQIKERVNFFWSTSHSQVYPELSRLEGEGLLTHQVVEQRDRPDKKVYFITEQGLEALRQWVTAPISPQSTREELVLKSYCVWVADPKKAAIFFREHEHLHEERLLDYERRQVWMEQKWGEDVRGVNSPGFASYAALRRGIGYEREYAEWCRWLAGELETGAGEVDPVRDESP